MQPSTLIIRRIVSRWSAICTPLLSADHTLCVICVTVCMYCTCVKKKKKRNRLFALKKVLVLTSISIIT